MSDEENTIVGIGEIIIQKSDSKLSAIGLGSCVGVLLFDINSAVRGLAHIMLPNSSSFAGKKEDFPPEKLSRYADVAIPFMIKKMTEMGAKAESLHAKLVGGAQMFPELENPNSLIGKKNTEVIKKLLQENNITIEAEDLGGNNGRSIQVNSQNSIHIRTIEGEKDI